MINKTTLKARAGVFLELTALIGLALFVVFVALGVNTYLVKTASQELRTKTDAICGNLINNALTKEDFKEQFLLAIQSLKINSVGSFFSLKEVDLVVPSLPGVIASANEDFNISVAGVSNPVKVNISYNTNDSQVSGWKAIKDLTAGMSVGCTIKGTVNLLSIEDSPDSNVEAKSFYWRPVIAAPEVNNDITAPVGGVYLAIAPHMTTRSDNISLAMPPGDSSEYLAKYSSKTPGPFFEGATIGSISYKDAINGYYKENPSSLVPWYPPSFNESSYLLVASNVSELVMACSNLAALYRNSVARSLYEIINQHGQLAGSNEVLIVGTQNENLDWNSLIDSTEFFNGPSVLKNMSVDSQSYYPIVKYEDIRGTLVNPFANVDTNLAKYHSTVAGQLQYCQHLYRSNGTSQHAKIFPGPLAELDADFDEGLLQLNSTDSSPFHSWQDVNKAEDTGNIISTLGTIQRCPAVIPETSTSNCSKPISPEGHANQDRASYDLNPDLLGLLNYLIVRQQDNHSNCNPNIFNPNTAASFPLANFNKATANDNLFAFPWSNVYSSDKSDICTEDSLVPVIIITHRRLSTRGGVKSEVNQIRKKITNDLNRQKFIVIYIPTEFPRPEDNPGTILDESEVSSDISGNWEKEIDNFKDAFNAEISELYEINDQEVPMALRNRVVVLGPDPADLSSSLKSDERLLFQQYWDEGIFDDGSENYFFSMAKNIFLGSIVLPERIR